MTFSYLDHHTLSPDDITAFEHLITAYNEYGGHPPRPEPTHGEWVLSICSTVTGPDGQWHETEGVFKRWGSTQHTPNGTHTEFVLMQFTAQGQALPGHGHGARTTLNTPPTIRPEHSELPLSSPTPPRPRIR